MRFTPDQQKKGLAIGAFVLLAGGILYYQLSDDSPAPRPAAVAPAATVPTPNAGPTLNAARTTPGTAKSVGTTSAQLDPTLHMEAMLTAEHVAYEGSGRNIFSANSAPVDIPKPVAAARPKGVTATPVSLAPLGPPPPPPIDLKFFGVAISGGKREAFLLHGQDVFLAKDGDIVQRRYQVITVLNNSVVVEDKTNNNRQTLPLVMH
ncbi:MAG: hypothetical protein PW789_12950 [Edaphobacter sp.]|uniref:hypothetical protein n=1 Tax=Edaphobacter sp. TaxID=1934404 RepID=UPI002389A141|nr:hypothetical protein [Edaphobacter sp.]MDE1177492.1 hypothetical protein [Edaphobacter sp.]